MLCAVERFGAQLPLVWLEGIALNFADAGLQFNVPRRFQGSAQPSTKDFMPGTATQCASLAGSAGPATRPSSSSTCTELALQRLHSLGVVSRASKSAGRVR